MNGNAERRATCLIAVALAVTTVAALGLAVVYLAGGQNQLEGSPARDRARRARASRSSSRRASCSPRVRSPRTGEPLESSPDDIEAFARDFDAVYDLDPDGTPRARWTIGVARRKLLARMLGAAAGALGLAALFPIASLGPAAGQLAVRHQVAQGLAGGQRAGPAGEGRATSRSAG